jgi:hypothetical protein
LLLNWLTGGYETIQIEAGRKADQNMGERFLAGRKPGALWLFDLGFFNALFLSAIASAGSFFLCRLAAAQLVFWTSNSQGELERLDLDLLLHSSPRELFEIKVVFGAKQNVAARLIIAPVPSKIAAQRRRKVREAARKQGRMPTKKTLDRCDWTLLLTNTSDEQLPTSTVLAVYAVRWQIELTFKLFKSDANLEMTLATEKNRAECEFYAKLIALLLFNRVSGLVEELVGEKISPPKLWRRMRGDLQDWLRALGQYTVAEVSDLVNFIAPYARTASRNKAASTLKRLEQAGQQARQVYLDDPLGFLKEKKETAAKRFKTFTRYLLSSKVSLNPERLGYQTTVSEP